MSARPTEALAAQHAEVKAEIARTDTKTGLLLAFVGAVLAGAWTIARDLPSNTAAYGVGGAGLALLLLAVVLMLRAVRPRLGGRHGFPHWATLSPGQLTDVAATRHRDLAADVIGLSRLAVSKFTCLRRAIDLVCAGGTLLITAVLIALGGAA
jgi:pycsar effector protein